MLSRSMPAPPRPSRLLSPGVRLESLAPGGRNGPNDEIRGGMLPGGQTWTDALVLGDDRLDFQTLIPDIRLPPNQYWPLHWHDCWIGIVILDGTCLIGDWWMGRGDIMVTAASLEYGPLLVGPDGCRMFEIFANQSLYLGGYAPEYRDHPTLIGTASRFMERSALNRRNEGRQILPLAGIEGIVSGHLADSAEWDLGDASDPERSVMSGTRLAPGEPVGAHAYDDWHAIFVLDGEACIADETIRTDDVLLIEPGCRVDEIVAGPVGAHCLEIARTARGMARRPAQA